MNVFDDLYAAAAAPNHVELFGESIVYHPLGGTQRTIQAIVDRIDVAVINGVRHAVAPRIVIEVHNDAVTGIASTELNTGGDLVEVAVREGGPATTRTITKLLSDGAMLRLEIR